MLFITACVEISAYHSFQSFWNQYESVSQMHSTPKNKKINSKKEWDRNGRMFSDYQDFMHSDNNHHDNYADFHYCYVVKKYYSII